MGDNGDSEDNGDNGGHAMFEKLRKPGRAKSLASYVIFGLICLVFVFIGVPVSQISNMGGSAMIVNNKVISWSEYQSYLEMLEQNAQSAPGKGLEARRQEQLRRQAVDTLLNTELIVQSAGEIGLVSAEGAVRDKVVNMELFQEEGRFSHSRYRTFLEARRFSAGYFENLLRREIQTAHFQNMFNLAVSGSRAERLKRQTLKSFKARVSYIQFMSSELNPKEWNNVSRMVEAGDADLLSQFIADKKWEWSNTKVFDLNRVSLPGLDSHPTLFDAVLTYLPKTGLIQKIVPVRNQSFVLRVDDFQRESAPTPQELAIPSMDVFANTILTRSIFMSWIQHARKIAKIKYNPRLMSLLSTPPSSDQ